MQQEGFGQPGIYNIIHCLPEYRQWHAVPISLANGNRAEVTPEIAGVRKLNVQAPDVRHLHDEVFLPRGIDYPEAGIRDPASVS